MRYVCGVDEHMSTVCVCTQYVVTVHLQRLVAKLNLAHGIDSALASENIQDLFSTALYHERPSKLYANTFLQLLTRVSHTNIERGRESWL